MPYIILKNQQGMDLNSFITAYSLAHLCQPDKIRYSTNDDLYRAPNYSSAAANNVDYVQAYCSNSSQLKKCIAIEVPKLKNDKWIIQAKGSDYAGYIDDADLSAIKSQVEILNHIGQMEIAQKAIAKSLGVWDGGKHVRLYNSPHIDDIERDIKARIDSLKQQISTCNKFIKRNTELFDFG